MEDMSPMATVLYADGRQRDVEPNNGTDFQLEELYRLLDVKMIEVVPLRETEQLMIIDEEGKLNDKPHNRVATAIAHFQSAIMPDDHIVGHALICDKSELT